LKATVFYITINRMKFICDDNLGKLAKFLRLLGYDTYFDPTIENARLIAIALKENRIVLTRDRRILAKIDPAKLMHIDCDDPEKQLAKVFHRFGLIIDDKAMFSRCLVCNELCRNAAADEIADRVFPFILKTQSRFHQCPSCHRIYWQGTHHKAMIDRLKKILGEKYFQSGR